MPAVDHHGDVDVGDVAFAQSPLARDAVTDNVVGRDAEGVVVAAIVETGGQGAVVEDEFPRHPVQIAGDNSGDHVGGQHVQAFGGQASGASPALEPLPSVDLDLAPADLRFPIVFD